MDELLKDQLNQDIIALLVLTKITPTEKKLWTELLPHMTLTQKENLKKNLQDELAYEMRTAEKALTDFADALDNESATQES